MPLFTDIQTAHALVSLLPEKARPYARLMRLDRPIGIWLLLLPCWWGVAFAADFFPNLWFMFLFAIGAILMRGAGCVINDIYDRNIDSLVERTSVRPLPSGEVSVFKACLFATGLLALSFGVLLLFNTVTVITGIASLVLVFTYPLMKRITWWPQLFLGFAFNWGVLMGSAAVTEGIGFSHIFAYIGGIFWTLAYDTIYAHQDKKDDVLIGVKSTALLFDQDSFKWVSLFYALSLAFLWLAGWAEGDGLGRGYEWGLLIAAMFAFVQMILWKPDDPENCLRRFKANREFGFIVLVAIILGKLV